MSQHLTGEDISRYRERLLATAEIARVQDHADECENCRDRLAVPGAAAALLALLQPEPDEQELVRFVAGKLPAPRAAEIAQHVEGCAQCAEVVDDLRQFAQPSASRPIPLAARRVHKAPWGALAAAVALVAGLGWWMTSRPGAAVPELASLHDAGSGRLVLLASGEVAGIAGLDWQERAWLTQALRAGRLPAPDSPWVAPQGGVLRGADSQEGFRMLGPLNARLVSDRPEFRWEPLPGANSYKVAVFTENEQVVAQSGPITATEWQPATPLPRETKLAWQVTALRGDAAITEPSPPKPLTLFEVMSAAAAARIEAARSQAAPSHLLLAALYAREGLTEEAASQLALLAKENPGLPLIDQLQHSLPAR